MKKPFHVNLPGFDITFGNNLPFVLLAGPCVVEGRDHALKMAEGIKKITDKLNIPFIYKSSFDKANRTSIDSFRGIDFDECLRIFEDVRKAFDCPIVTDVHLPEQCALVADVVDILQIPAFLCRQTDLLVAAAKTGKCINVKKGQFAAPWDMVNVVRKIEDAGNSNVMLCERGVSFGYNTLVSDFRSLPIMAETGKPIVFDATHSVQQPGGKGTSSSGQREFVPVLARAAMAVGVAAVFAEVHDNPDAAPSDGPNMLKLSDLEAFLTMLKSFDELRKSMTLE